MSLPTDHLMLIECEDYLLVPLQGAPVVRVSIDAAFAIAFPELEVLLTAPFRLVHGDQTTTIDPADLAQVAQALHVLRKEGASLVAHRDGRLELRFGDGAVLSAEPHPIEEAWEVEGANGFHVVCLPGGELDLWTPEAAPPDFEA
ncbi:MAG TPA: DUF6188 family protein [Oscillatoriaceae cyanobacterium]